MDLRVYCVPDGARSTMLLHDKYSNLLLQKGIPPISLPDSKAIHLRASEMKASSHTSGMTTPIDMKANEPVLAAVQKTLTVPVTSENLSVNHIKSSDPYALISTFGAERIEEVSPTSRLIEKLLVFMRVKFGENFAILGARRESIYQALHADTHATLYSSVQEPFSSVDPPPVVRNDVMQAQYAERDPIKKLECLVLPIVQRFARVLYIGSSPSTYLTQFPLVRSHIFSFDPDIPAFVAKAKTGVKHFRTKFTTDSFGSYGITADAIIIDYESVSSSEQTSEMRAKRHQEYLDILVAASSREFKFFSVKWRPRPGDEEPFRRLQVPTNAKFMLQPYNGKNSYESRMEGYYPIEGWTAFNPEAYFELMEQWNHYKGEVEGVQQTQFDSMFMRFAIKGDFLMTATREENIISTFAISNTNNEKERVLRFLKSRKHWAVTYPMLDVPSMKIGDSKVEQVKATTKVVTVVGNHDYVDNGLYSPQELSSATTGYMRVSTLSEVIPYMEGFIPGVNHNMRMTYLLSNFSFPMNQLNQGPSSTLGVFAKEYSGMLRSALMLDSTALYEARIKVVEGVPINSSVYTYYGKEGLVKVSGHAANLLSMSSYLVIPIERYLRSTMRKHDSTYYTYGEDIASSFHTEKEILEGYDTYLLNCAIEDVTPKYTRAFIRRNLWTNPVGTVTIVQKPARDVFILDDEESYYAAAMELGKIDYMPQFEEIGIKIKIDKVIHWMLFDILVNRRVSGQHEFLKQVREYRIE